MLNEIMGSIHNYFEVVGGAHSQQWVIEGGKVSLPFIQDGQFFRVQGSVFNDGVHRYTDELELIDEEFAGTITALAVPADFLSLAKEIKEWQEQNGDKVTSPYISESFGGYSYSKTTGSGGTGKETSWYSMFRSRLRRYRKI